MCELQRRPRLNHRASQPLSLSLRRFLELREAHEARLASSSGGGVKKKAKNKVEGFEWHGSYQKDFRRQLRVHSHVLFTPLPSIMRDVAAGIVRRGAGAGDAGAPLGAIVPPRGLVFAICCAVCRLLLST